MRLVPVLDYAGSSFNGDYVKGFLNVSQSLPVRGRRPVPLPPQTAACRRLLPLGQRWPWRGQALSESGAWSGTGNPRVKALWTSGDREDQGPLGGGSHTTVAHSPGFRCSRAAAVYSPIVAFLVFQPISETLEGGNGTAGPTPAPTQLLPPAPPQLPPEIGILESTGLPLWVYLTIVGGSPPSSLPPPPSRTKTCLRI